MEVNKFGFVFFNLFLVLGDPLLVLRRQLKFVLLKLFNLLLPFVVSLTPEARFVLSVAR